MPKQNNEYSVIYLESAFWIDSQHFSDYTPTIAHFLRVHFGHIVTLDEDDTEAWVTIQTLVLTMRQLAWTPHLVQ